MSIKRLKLTRLTRSFWKRQRNFPHLSPAPQQWKAGQLSREALGGTERNSVQSIPDDIGVRDYAKFVGVVTLAHVVTYILAGMLAYEFIYRNAIDMGGFDQFMRTPNEPEEWQHVETWLFPAQILRGALFGLALCPFLTVLSSWSFRKRFCALLFVLLVFSVWSVTMPGPGSIEGWLYLRPGAAPKLPNPLLGYIEVPVQLACFTALIAWRIGKAKKKRFCAQQDAEPDGVNAAG